MATDFFWSYTDEPHASRRRQILAQHPRIRDLFGPDPFAFLKIAVVVLLQLWTATLLRDASFTKLLLVAYFFGSILNHNLFLAMRKQRGIPENNLLRSFSVERERANNVAKMWYVF